MSELATLLTRFVPTPDIDKYGNLSSQEMAYIGKPDHYHLVQTCIYELLIRAITASVAYGTTQVAITRATESRRETPTFYDIRKGKQ